MHPKYPDVSVSSKERKKHNKSYYNKQCLICDRSEGLIFTEHHLIPKSKGGKKGPTVVVCEDCHNNIHLLFTNKELNQNYFTVELLLASEKIQKYVTYIRKQKKRSSVAIKKKR